ncbi:MAG: glycosyltransferase family 2 protein [Pseudomonadota bacterium]
MATLHILILNWNGLDDSIECIDALLASSHTDFLAHVIDNGSAGDDAEVLRSRYAADRRVAVTRNSNNLGFTGGMNKALRELLAKETSGYVFLLNNDALVAPDCLARVLDAAERSSAAIVGTRMVRYDDPTRLDNAGHIWINTGEILPRGAGDAANTYAESTELVGACAGAALYSLELLREIGVFDDFFDTGYEDAELGLRAYLAGYPTYLCADALVRHKVSRSIDKIRNLDYAINIQRNINYTILKLTPLPTLLLNAPFILVKTLAVPLTALILLRFRLFRAHITALWRTSKYLGTALRARRSVPPTRLTTGQTLAAQRFFLGIYLGYFRDYMLTGEPTVFER